MKVVLDSDEKRFGGHGRVDRTENYYLPIKERYRELDFHFKIYLPSRCVIVLEKS